MTEFKAAHDRLSNALMRAEVDSPEWIKIRAALVALEEAEHAAARDDFVTVSRRLGDAVSRLEAIVGGLEASRAGALADVRATLDLLQPLLSRADDRHASEAASAVFGMPEVNIASFPETATMPRGRRAPPVTSVATGSTTVGASIDAMVDTILKHEGGFVNHPNDRGGPTNFGITLKTLANCRGCKPSDLKPRDVQALRLEEARDIYRQVYFTRPRIDKLPELLQPLVFDMSINHGPGTAVKLLQEVLQAVRPPCSVDGGIGDETIQCARAAARDLGDALVNKLVDRRVKLFHAIVRNDPSQQVFLKGWLRRAESFRLA